MFYLKIAMIYSILFAITAGATLSTSFNNPAISFFIPSIFSMMVYGKLKLTGQSMNVMKHALSCGLVFALVTVGVSFVIQIYFNWLKTPLLLYGIAFAGNFLFPFLLFPKINKAQDS